MWSAHQAGPASLRPLPLHGEARPAAVPGSRFAWLLPLALAATCMGPPARAQSTAGGSPNQPFDQQLAAAAAAYNRGEFAQAATALEKLLAAAPSNFELHELLGLSYAREGQNEHALQQLAFAVKLRPGSAAAWTNLGTSLARAGERAKAEEDYRRALALEPGDYEANHDLAESCIEAGRLNEALPLLESARRAQPASYSNGYDLALAYLLTGKLDQAQSLVASLLQARDTGELHILAGRIDEQQSRFIEAANEFAVAAHMDPSEDNLFVWASELLLHRTYVPAIDVYKQATQLYPHSPRLWIGLGMALYSRGEYPASIRALLTAADLEPNDPRCYLFLSKAYLSSPDQAEEVIERFRRYAELEPQNALAQYYYAISLWKGRRLEDGSIDFKKVESLLLRSIALDGSAADAHLQLGILYNDQHEYAKSLPEYERALQLNRSLADAHYRLGQYYVHAGEKEKAQHEFETFRELQAQHQAAVDKERAEVQQFVVSSVAEPASKR